jgi:hypothetical protein
MPVMADLPEAGEGINAVRANRSSRGGRGGRGHKGDGNGQAKQQLESDASMATRLASGLCLKHWRYGEHAHSCTAPCSWQGNEPARGN